MTTTGHATLQPIGVLEHMGELAPLKFSASEVTTLLSKQVFFHGATYQKSLSGVFNVRASRKKVPTFHHGRLISWRYTSLFIIIIIIIISPPAQSL